MPDDIYKSRYTAAQIDAALTTALSIAGNSGVPVGTGEGSIRIHSLDTSKLSNLDGRIPSSAAVCRAIDASRTVSRLMNFKGIVDLVDDLPADPAVGDTYQVTSASTCYSWNGKTWLDAGDLCIIGPQGDKGDSFTYDDFTPEQLAALVGPKGDTPKKILDSVSYQIGDSGKTVPTGEWSDSIPDVQKGKYLWTRRVQQWDTGEAVTDYSVSYFGIDGSGTVNAVSGVSPDETGNVPLTAADVGALAVSGGDMEGPINMNGQPISGLNPPTEDTQAANKGYVDTAKAEAISHANTVVRKAAPRNLLDNSDFRNPVNQRGITNGVYTGWNYFLDRWRGIDNVNVSLTSPGLKIANGQIAQSLSENAKIPGKTYTFVVGLASGAVRFVVYTLPSETVSSWVVFGSANYGDMKVECGGDKDNYNVLINARSEITIEWAALYEGEYTAETLPEYQPKGYGAELAECQRYFVRIETVIPAGYTYSDAKTAQVFIPLNAKLRVAGTDTLPTLSLVDAGTIRSNGKLVVPTAISTAPGWVTQTGIVCAITGDYSGIGSAQTVVSVAMKLDISADL